MGPTMSEEDWKEEYKEWKDLKPFQIQLLDEGPKTLSQTWLVNQMWCDWEKMNKKRGQLSNDDLPIPRIDLKDPWED